MKALLTFTILMCFALSTSAKNETGLPTAPPANDDNNFEISISHVYDHRQEKRRFFMLAWNKKTGNYQIYNPVNVFKEVNPVPPRVLASKEAIAPYLHEKGDIMFKTQTYLTTQFQYEFVVWNTYSGKMGLFVFDWTTKSFKLKQHWDNVMDDGHYDKFTYERYPVDLDKDLGEDRYIMVDYQTDHGQEYRITKKSFIAWDKHNTIGGNINFSIHDDPPRGPVEELYPNYNPDVDGDIMVSYDIGLAAPSFPKKSGAFGNARFQTGAIIYTSKSMKYRWVTRYSTNDHHKDLDDEDKQGLGRVSPVGLEYNRLPDFVQSGHEYEIQHALTYQMCQEHNAQPYFIIADLTSKELKFGSIINKELTLHNHELNFHKSLFEGNDGEMGIALSLDPQFNLADATVIVYNKKTGHFAMKLLNTDIGHSVYSRFDPDRWKFICQDYETHITCNILDAAHYSTGAGDGLEMKGSCPYYGQGADIRPFRPNYCDLRAGKKVCTYKIGNTGNGTLTIELEEKGVDYPETYVIEPRSIKICDCNKKAYDAPITSGRREYIGGGDPSHSGNFYKRPSN